MNDFEECGDCLELNCKGCPLLEESENIDNPETGQPITEKEIDDLLRGNEE